MGVIPCDRYECDNIMCDRSSLTYGRICDKCFEELVATAGSVSIREFMEEGNKGTVVDPNFWYDKYDEIFPLNEHRSK